MTRHAHRLLYTLVSLLLAAQIAHATPPTKTLISDTVYRADGSPAAGTLVISWPAFTTATGKAVAAGSMSVPIGAAGAVALELVPTQGATPAGTYYRVTLKLKDGTSTTEYWAVPTLSPTTISAIRSTVIPAGVAVQVVSREYVDGAIASAYPNPLTIAKGGTGNTSFSAARCVRISDDGTQLESAAADCDAGNADTLDGMHATQLGGESTSANVSSRSGTDLAARITAAIAAMGNDGGRLNVDIAGGGTIASDVLSSISKPVHLAFSGGAYSLAGTAITTPKNVTVEVLPGATLNVSEGATLTILGRFSGPLAQTFTGAGRVILRGNETLYPQWFGARGDGVTDDHDAFDHCLNWSPSAHCLAVKTQLPTAQNQPDYVIGSTLRITNNGAVLEGTGSSAWSSSTYLKCTMTGTPCIQQAASGITIKHLDIWGVEGWNFLDIGTYHYPNANHGIVMSGSRGRLEDISVYNFNGHCIVMGGNAGVNGWADDTWYINGSITQGCRGYGIFTGDAQTSASTFACSPSDSSAGTSVNQLAYFNQMGGIGECSRFGNTYIGPHFDSNARNSTYRSTGAGWQQTALSRSGNVVTASLAAAMNSLAINDVVRLNAPSTALDGLDCTVTTISDAYHFTCATAASGAVSATGTLDWVRSPVSSISRSSNVVTVTTASPIINLAANSWLYFSASGTPLDGAACEVLSSSDAHHATCHLAGADVGPTSVGFASVAATHDVFAFYRGDSAHGNWDPGAFYASSGTVIQPYCEMNQEPGIASSMVLGPTNCTPLNGTLRTQNFIGMIPGGARTPLFPGDSWLFRNYSDADSSIGCRAGLTLNAACSFAMYDKDGNAAYVVGPLSGSAGFVTWGLHDIKNAYWPLQSSAGGSTYVSAGATGNTYVEGAGALIVNNSSGLQVHHNGLKAAIDNTGAATLTKISGITDATQVANLNADMVDGKHAADFTAANQACQAGQYVNGINASGAVACGTPSAGQGTNGKLIVPFAVASSLSASQSTTLTEISAYTRQKVDLSGYTQFRAVLTTTATGWNTDTYVRAMFKTNDCAGVIGAFSQLQDSGTTGDILHIPDASVNVGQWVNLNAAAKADVCLTFGTGGANGTSKTVFSLSLQFK